MKTIDEMKPDIESAKPARKIVRRYKLSFSICRQDVMMPEGAEILTARMDDDDLLLWAFVDAEAPSTVPREIEIQSENFTVNAEVPRRFIATAQTHHGSPCWHIFERLEYVY